MQINRNGLGLEIRRFSLIGVAAIGGMVTLAGKAPAQSTVTAFAFTPSYVWDGVTTANVMGPFETSKLSCTDYGVVWTTFMSSSRLGSASAICWGQTSRDIFLPDGISAGTNSAGQQMSRVRFADFPHLAFTPSGRAYCFQGYDRNESTGNNVRSLWAGTTAGSDTFWDSPGATLRPVARVGDLVSADPQGPVWSQLYGDGVVGGINEFGVVAFQASLAGQGIDATNNDVIWLNNPANPATSPLISEGSPVPGISGAFFGDFVGGAGLTNARCAPQITNSGEVTFIAPIVGPSVVDSNKLAMFTARSAGDISLVFRTGQSAPGHPATYKLTDFSRPTITPNDQRSFLGRVTGAGSTRMVAYVHGSTGWTVHLAESDYAPGFPASWLVSSIINSWIGSNGGILTTGIERNGNVTRKAIWYGSPRNAQLVVAEGAFAPGLTLPSGQVNTLATFVPNTLGVPAANDNGEVVFRAEASDRTNYYVGIWAWDAVRGLRILTKNSQPVVGNAVGPFPTIGGVTYTYSNHTILDLYMRTSDAAGNTISPEANSINNSGEVFFKVISDENALCSANTRPDSGFVLPVFRPDSVAAEESPFYMIVRNTAADDFRLSALRVAGDVLEATGVDGYLGFSDDTHWVVVGSGDFDGDGILDILWQNDQSGSCVVWVMQDGAPWPSSLIWLGNSDAAGGWRVRAVCDLDRDGVPDVIWQNDLTGRAGVWKVSRNAQVYSVAWRNLWAAGAPLDKIVSSADLTGDGFPDLILRHLGPPGDPANGSCSAWAQKNFVGDGTWPLPWLKDLNWTLIGVADVDRDGANDMIWWWTGGGMYDGALAYWRLSGTRFVEGRSIYGSVDPSENVIAPITPVLPR